MYNGKKPKLTVLGNSFISRCRCTCLFVLAEQENRLRGGGGAVSGGNFSVTLFISPNHDSRTVFFVHLGKTIARSYVRSNSVLTHNESHKYRFSVVLLSLLILFSIVMVVAIDSFFSDEA
jgi:hypothetical protein